MFLSTILKKRIHYKTINLPINMMRPIKTKDLAIVSQLLELPWWREPIIFARIVACVVPLRQELPHPAFSRPILIVILPDLLEHELVIDIVDILVGDHVVAKNSGAS